MRPAQSTMLLVLGGGCLLLGGAALGWLSRPHLPRYELHVEGGRTPSLGAQPLLVLDADSPLSITLRPEVASPRGVFVRAVVEEQSQYVAWPVIFESAEQGTQRLQGTVGELYLPCRRRCTLMLYVSDFAGFSALLWLAPALARLHYLPRTQILQTNLLIEPTAAALPDR